MQDGAFWIPVLGLFLNRKIQKILQIPTGSPCTGQLERQGTQTHTQGEVNGAAAFSGDLHLLHFTALTLGFNK